MLSCMDHRRGSKLCHTSIRKPSIASESPTRTISMPAWSATNPDGKSCAVIIVIGVPASYKLRNVFLVTFFRIGAARGSIGACELYNFCWILIGGTVADLTQLREAIITRRRLNTEKDIFARDRDVLTEK